MIWRSYDELSRDEFHDLLRLRQDVFILEQQSFYPDIDGRDRISRHLLIKDGENLLATARILPPDEARATSLGRVAVLPSARGRRLGRALVQACLQKLAELYPDSPVVIGAQAHLCAFYGGFGFFVVGDIYDDGGINH